MAETLYLSKTQSAIIPIGGTMLYDTVVSTTGGISYNPANGMITLNEVGRYQINWWNATNAIGNSAPAVFSIIASNGQQLIGNSPLQKGIITGLGIINVTVQPVTFSLINLSSGSAQMSSNVPIKGMLSVSQELSVNSNVTLLDFQYQQFANTLSQIITYYPTTLIRAYTPGLYAIDGTPNSLYTSPEAASAGIFTMLESTELQSVALNTIVAFRTGQGTTYNESISYLDPPTPLPEGWDTNIITAIHDYLTIGQEVTVYWGIGNSTEGFVYRNEYGMLVVTSDMSGANPYFILPTSTLIIITPSETGERTTLKVTGKGIVKSDLLSRL